jgi:hypothetical protein
MAIGIQPAPAGIIGAVKRSAADPQRASGLVFDGISGHYRRERANLLYVPGPRPVPVQQRILAFLRDNVHPEIPRTYYRALLGHDLHISMWAELYVQHYHATERDPFTGEMGWLENVGRVSCGKVTTAFRDFESNNLRTDTTEYGDFKFHEVGTSTAAEANTQTALTTTSGIARVTGTQAGTAPDYVSVATVTADTSETWGEHGLFSQVTGGTMMDRSLISPTVAVVASDTVTFTYTLSKAAEA